MMLSTRQKVRARIAVELCNQTASVQQAGAIAAWKAIGEATQLGWPDTSIEAMVDMFIQTSVDLAEEALVADGANRGTGPPRRVGPAHTLGLG